MFLLFETKHLLLVGLAGVLLLYVTSLGLSSDQIDREFPTVTLAMNTFQTEFKKEESVQVGVALINSGENPVYVPALNRCWVTLKNDQGQEVRRGDLPEPPSPPPHYYMEIDGKKTLLEPVWKLKPGDGKIFVDDDVLRYYKDSISLGYYSFAWESASMLMFDEKNLLFREDTDEKLWVQVKSPKERIMIQPSNSVRIKIQ